MNTLPNSGMTTIPVFGNWWDGKLPVYYGADGTPLIQIPN
jgi:hypothetical protein